MCGIAGYVGTTIADLMLSKKIAHRGPDDYGLYQDGLVHLEHRRLSIIDVSERGHQPMSTEDGNLVIIFNGEIYNHREIRKELLEKGCQFKSDSDTESLLLGYQAFGLNILNKLNGIFAFIIYDKLKQEVLLARDQFGIKPLYYYDLNGLFMFSSEIKAFLSHPQFSRAVDYGAIFNYLQYLYCPAPLTPFLHVKKLEPGHYMKIQLRADSYSSTSPVRYYEIPFNGQTNKLSEAEWIEQIDFSLNKAVKNQLLSDVPVGFFLSGGLDSSLIVALARKNGLENIETFTIDPGQEFVNEGFADDLGYATKVAKHLGVKLNVIEAKPDLLNDWDKLVWHLDEPQADPAALHVFNISKGARAKGIKVLLGGTGGDDVFSGYRRHQFLKAENIIDLAPLAVRKLLAKGVDKLPMANPSLRRFRKAAFAMAQPGSERMVNLFEWQSAEKVQRLFNKDIQSKIDYGRISKNHFLKLLEKLPSNESRLNQMLFLELKTFLVDHNLNYTDKMSMAAGVEARVPFLDIDLVNLSTKIPSKFKMNGTETKYVLKKVAERYLPKDVIYRSKTGFGAPVRHWVNNDLRPLINEHLSVSKLEKRGLFDPAAVRNLIDQNFQGREDNAYQILSLLTIESWLSQFIDR
jgi:asparagine synthase (glutamine-hydrolysing)